MKHIATSVAHRLRTADLYDWMFGLLFTALGLLIALLAFNWLQEDAEPWGAVSFQAPVEIKTILDVRPTVEGRPDLPAPALSVGDGVPLRVTRFVDCAVYKCPSGGIAVTADVAWQQITVDGGTGFRYLQFDDYDATYVEFEDYIPGQLVASVEQPDLVPVPDAVIEHLEETGATTSAWRIEGVSVPQIPGATTAAWSSEVFHLSFPEAAGEVKE